MNFREYITEANSDKVYKIRLARVSGEHASWTRKLTAFGNKYHIANLGLLVMGAKAEATLPIRKVTQVEGSDGTTYQASFFDTENYKSIGFKLTQAAKGSALKPGHNAFGD